MGQIILHRLEETMGAMMPIFELPRSGLDQTWEYCRHVKPWKHEFVWCDATDTNSFGFGLALEALPQAEPDSPSPFRFTMKPNLVREAMLSLEHLGLTQPHASEMKLDPFDLGIQVGRGGRGWGVWANLGEMFWTTVDRDRETAKRAILESINAWFRSTGGDRDYHVHIHEGCYGLTIEIHHPQGGGLWLAGHRVDSIIEAQFCEHNTDTAPQALAHLITLALMRDTVRALAPVPP